MTFLVSSDPLISGGFAVRAYPGFGILGADIPDEGDSGPSPVLNDTGIVSDGQYYWFAETFPSSGTLTLYPDLTFTFEGAADGAYTWTYRVGDQTGESATVGTVTLTIGTTDGAATGSITSITVTPPVASAAGTSIVSGAASGALPSVVFSSTAASAIGTSVGDGFASGPLSAVSLLVPLATALGTSITFYPDPSDVRLGVTYGPTGTEYTGTMTGGSGPSASEIAAAVVAAMQTSPTPFPSNVTHFNGNPTVGSGQPNDPVRPA